MLARRTSLQICGCGVARARGDRIVITPEGMVYCSGLCQLKHAKEPKSFEPAPRPMGPRARIDEGRPAALRG